MSDLDKAIAAGYDPAAQHRAELARQAELHASLAACQGLAPAAEPEASA